MPLLGYRLSGIAIGRPIRSVACGESSQLMMTLSARPRTAAALKPMNTTKDIADNCGIKEGTLAYWRSAGIGPKFVKVGRIVMYPKEQMIAYFAQHLYQCTAEYEEEVGA